MKNISTLALLLLFGATGFGSNKKTLNTVETLKTHLCMAEVSVKGISRNPQLLPDQVKPKSDVIEILIPASKMLPDYIDQIMNETYDTHYSEMFYFGPSQKAPKDMNIGARITIRLNTSPEGFLQYSVLLDAISCKIKPYEGKKGGKGFAGFTFGCSTLDPRRAAEGMGNEIGQVSLDLEQFENIRFKLSCALDVPTMSAGPSFH